MSVLTLRLHRCGPELGEARSIYENELKAIDEALKVRAKEKRTPTLDDFVSHLLDVHRRWCETCPQPGGRGVRPTTGRDPDATLLAAAGNHNSEKKNSRKHKNCVSTATQTTFDKYGLLIESKELPDIHADLVDDEDDDDGFVFEDIEDNGDFEDSSVIDEQDGNPKPTTHGLPEELRVGDFHLQPDDKEIESYDQHQLQEATQVSDAMQIKQERLTPDLCDGDMDEIDSTAHQRLEADCDDEFQVESVQAGSVVVKYEDDFPEHQDDDMDTWSGMNPSTSQQVELQSIPPDINDQDRRIDEAGSHATSSSPIIHDSSNNVEDTETGDVDASQAKKMRKEEKKMRKEKKKMRKEKKKNRKKEKKFVCDVCGKKYHCQQDFEYHKTMHPQKKTSQCTICKEAFQKRGDLLIHLRTHEGEKPFKCSVCGKDFLKESTLKDHMINHGGVKPHVCSYCEKAFIGKGQLTRHLRIHTGEKPYQCSICDKRFSQTGSRDVHMKSHLNEKPIKCDFCDYATYVMSALVSHTKTRHPVIKPIKCDFCHFTTYVMRALVSHTKTRHPAEKPYVLSALSKRYVRQGELEDHPSPYAEELHQDSAPDQASHPKAPPPATRVAMPPERPHACSFCDRTFIGKRDLSCHMRIHHSGDKPYRCIVCNETFSQKEILDAHMKNHIDKKKFKCHLCNFRGCNQSHLQEHMKTHAGENLYQCLVSGKGFVQSADLLKHVETHTGNIRVSVQLVAKDSPQM